VINIQIPCPAQRLAQIRDVARQGAFVNEGIGQEPGHQLVLFYQASAAFNQRDQHVKHFGRQPDRFALAQ
jgi:hypothetical protein